MRAGAQQVPAALGGHGGQLPGHHEIGELGLAVGGPGPVAALPLQVIEVDPAEIGHAAAHRDHARRRRGEHERQQPDGQRERAEEIAAELQLEAVGGAEAGRRRHHPGVVDQQVERRAVGDQAIGEVPDAGQVGEVDPAHLELRGGMLGQDLGPGPLALRGRADGHHDTRPGGGQAPGGFLAGPAVGAGNDGDLPALIGNDVHGGSSATSARPSVCYVFHISRLVV